MKLNSKLLKLLAVPVAAFAMIGATGCDDDGDVEDAMEDTGESIDNGMEDMNDAMNEAGNDIDNAVEDAGDDIDDATD